MIRKTGSPSKPALSWVRRIRQSRLAGDVTTLYGTHVLGLVVPLLTIPYLARVLGPAGWGAVLIAESLSAWLGQFVEYGFDLSGTRAVARVRHDSSEVADVVTGVQGAKLLVAATLQGAVFLLLFAVPLFRDQPGLLFWAWIYSLSRGLNPAWYFFGKEQVRLPGVLQAGAKVLAAIAIFPLVRGPEDAWRVLACYAVAHGAVTGWLTLMLYRSVPFARPRIGASIAMLRQEVGIFVFRASSSLLTQANAFVLGLLAPAPIVAFFGGAERLIRAAINLFHPLSQAMYPRVSHTAVQDPAHAQRLLRLGLVLFGGSGVVMGATAVIAAPLLVSVILGPGYEDAVPILRLLGALPPLVGLGTVLGIQWALPAGLERPFYRVVLASGILNLILAFVLVPRFGGFGMAMALVVAETCVVLGLLVMFASRRGRFADTNPVAGPLAAPPQGGEQPTGKPPAGTVHVVLSVRDSEPYIAAQIESIREQTLQEWTLWVRDDGSSDGTARVVADLARDDPRVRLCQGPAVHWGINRSFGWLLEQLPADAGYVFCADGDDVWMADKMARSLAVMIAEEARGSGPVLVHTDMAVTDADLSPIGGTLWGHMALDPDPVSLRRVLVQNVATGPTMLMNRALLDEVRPIPDAADSQDWWIALVAARFGRVVALHEPTAWYRRHASSDQGDWLLGHAGVRGLATRLRSSLARTARLRAGLGSSARQAGAFLERFGERLTDDERDFLRAYAEIPELTFLRRKLRVLRLRLRAEHGILRNLAVVLRA